MGRLQILCITLTVVVPLTFASLMEQSYNSSYAQIGNINGTSTRSGEQTVMLLSDRSTTKSPDRRRLQEQKRQKQQEGARPRMYTYFERIPIERRFTDMTDEDDDALLEFWKEAWEAAGWEAVILGLQDAQSHSRFQEFEDRIQALQLEDFHAIVLRRYLAMAAATKDLGGGWLCDYDAFPIRDFRAEVVPHNGEFTVHGTVPATLASASSAHWENILRALLDDAKLYMPWSTTMQEDEGGKLADTSKKRIAFKRNMWSDTLGIYNLLRHSATPIHAYRFVMAGSMLLMEPPPWNEETFCRKRQFRKKYRVVHMDVPSLLLSLSTNSTQRLPRHRAAVARAVVPLFERYCGVKIKEDVK